MTTYNIHDLVWSRGVSEPVREALLAMQEEIKELTAINAQLLEALEEMLVMWEDDPSYGSDTADKAYAAIKAAKGEV